MRDNQAMQRMTMAGLLGLLAACIHQTPTTNPVPELRCPVPTSCTIPNGTGVYFAEGGFAGIGSTDLMITHFINGPTVTVQARYFDSEARLWRALRSPGQLAAEYQGHTSLQVIELTETATAPTWKLRDPATNAIMVVTPDQLGQLKLALVADNGTHNVVFTLDFEGPASSIAGPWKNQESTYGLRWTDVVSKGPAVPYCHAPPTSTSPSSTAEWPPDSVVFQQGIYVDPVTGQVTRDASTANFVTMSCYLGAPATVYRWGYDHRGGDPTYFAAGIHMKRASYCGDAAYYTVSGTEIKIADNLAIQDDPIGVLEAWWTPTGASCLNPDGVRHPDIITQKGFHGSCSNGPLPPCTTPPRPPSTTHYLVDGRR